MPSRKGVKIPSRLPLIIPDNKHYLEFLVSRVGKQRLPGRVRREMIISGNYQRSGCASSVLHVWHVCADIFQSLKNQVAGRALDSRRAVRRLRRKHESIRHCQQVRPASARHSRPNPCHQVSRVKALFDRFPRHAGCLCKPGNCLSSQLFSSNSVNLKAGLHRFCLYN